MGAGSKRISFRASATPQGTQPWEPPTPPYPTPRGTLPRHLWGLQLSRVTKGDPVLHVGSLLRVRPGANGCEPTPIQRDARSKLPSLWDPWRRGETARQFLGFRSPPVLWLAVMGGEGDQFPDMLDGRMQDAHPFVVHGSPSGDRTPSSPASQARIAAR